MVLHLFQVWSCSVLINLRNNVLNFTVFTKVFKFKIGFSGINKHSQLPWQQFSYDLNNGHFRTSPVDIYLHSNLSGGQNFSFPTLFDSYRELLLKSRQKEPKLSPLTLSRSGTPRPSKSSKLKELKRNAD